MPGVGQAAKRHIALDVEFAPSFVDAKDGQVLCLTLVSWPELVSSSDCVDNVHTVHPHYTHHTMYGATLD